MKILILVVLTVFIFSGCVDPTKTENKHTYITIQKDDMVILDYNGYIDRYNSSPFHLDDNITYIVLQVSMDTYISIRLQLQLQCGASGEVIDIHHLSENNTSLEARALAEFTKQELDDHNCLQSGGQLEDLTGSLYGYAEYTQNRTTPTKHTVTSNSITYTAQEINEAFALFNE